MRVHLRMRGTNGVIPFDHQHLLVGTIHKWLGKRNDIHNKVALFSFSRIKGGTTSHGGLVFEKNISFFISAFQPEIIKSIISGVQKDPTMFSKLFVDEILIMEDPDLSAREIFFPGSPVLIKRRMDNEVKHLLYNDPVSADYLKETLLTKMKFAGLSDDGFGIQFDNTSSIATTKLIKYKGVENKTSWCPIRIKGSPELKSFAWNVGIGNSTGIGFGAIE